MAHVLITNVYGIRNKGDQLLVSELVSEIRRDFNISAVAVEADLNRAVFPEVDWIALPWRPRPGFWGRMIQLISAGYAILVVLFPLFSIGKYPRAIKRAEICIACPGGYIVDDSRSVWSHALQLCLVARLAKRFVLAPQSIGPWQSLVGKQLLRWVLRSADRVFLRDEFSMRYCRELLGPDAGLERAHDLALSKGARRFIATFAGSRTDGAAMRRIGLTIVARAGGSVSENVTYKSAIGRSVSQFLARGASVVVLPQTFDTSPSPDSKYAYELVERYEVELSQPRIQLEDFVRDVASVDFLIGTRLHSCLIALAAGVPFLNVSYLPKCQEILTEIGLAEATIPLVDLNAERIVWKSQFLFENWTGLRARALQRIDESPWAAAWDGFVRSL